MVIEKHADKQVHENGKQLIECPLKSTEIDFNADFDVKIFNDATGEELGGFEQNFNFAELLNVYNFSPGNNFYDGEVSGKLNAGFRSEILKNDENSCDVVVGVESHDLESNESNGFDGVNKFKICYYNKGADQLVVEKHADKQVHENGKQLIECPLKSTEIDFNADFDVKIFNDATGEELGGFEQYFNLNKLVRRSEWLNENGKLISIYNLNGERATNGGSVFVRDFEQYVEIHPGVSEDLNSFLSSLEPFRTSGLCGLDKIKVKYFKEEDLQNSIYEKKVNLEPYCENGNYFNYRFNDFKLEAEKTYRVKVFDSNGVECCWFKYHYKLPKHAG